MDLDDILTYVPSEESLIIMGDLNARIGNFSTDIYQPSSAKDLVVNSRGRQLIDIIRTYELSTLNGSTKSDPYGEFTFVNKNGSSCIDLCLINNTFEHDDLDFSVLDYEGSCHFPTLLSINSRPISSKIIKRKKLIWAAEKSQVFRDTLTSSLICHSSESISVSEISCHLISSLEICSMIRTTTNDNQILAQKMSFA
jgi:hypothetical protein